MLLSLALLGVLALMRDIDSDFVRGNGLDLLAG